jgi:pimeloyl-ACP methyl ester carboxylesterase
MWLTGLGAAALVAALPLLREAVRRPVAARRQEDAPTGAGRLVRLSHGLTHIREEGPAAGPVIVLVHGLTTPSGAFDAIAPDLVARGHRVIRYDHYGRGLSDRPRVAQGAEVFRAHLWEVLEACDVAGPVVLAGYSMGAAIVVDAAAHAPARAARLVLLAPAGLQRVAGPGPRGLSRLPLLGAWLFHMRYPSVLRRGIAAERSRPDMPPGMAELQLAELRHRGFLRLVRASLRGLLAAPQEAAHRRVAALGLPVTAVFGAQDAVIAPEARDRLAAWNPAAQCRLLEGAGHGLVYTHPDAVLEAIAPAAEPPRPRDVSHPGPARAS